MFTRKHSSGLFLRALLAALVLCFSSRSQAKDQSPFNILEALSKIEGLSFESVNSPDPKYLVFEMKYLQPEDHNHPEGPKFAQRLVLWHVNENRPMVLQTSGYAIFQLGLAALASEFQANQIQVEHRFFEGSTPASRNWELLTVAQSAADFHRITQAFKSIYVGKWVNTGRSKGGMTSVYHRRFYPNDLDATLAHVAPHSFSTSDPRYENFVAHQIGGDDFAFCREKLVQNQRVLLENKAELLDRLTGNYQQLGSKEIGLEHAIIELPWAYWQYSGPAADCQNVPEASASFEDHAAFLENNNDPSGYTDEELSRFIPYYFQAATQLGNPATPMKAILDLLDFAETFKITSYVPKEAVANYDGAETMRDVSEWLSKKSERILFVYGEFDPWTAGAYTEIRSEGDNYLFVAPKVNHSAQFIDLQGADRAFAYGKLRSWLNLESESTPAELSDSEEQKGMRSLRRAKNLDTAEFEYFRSMKQRR